LAQQGYNLILVARNEARLEALSQQLSRQHRILADAMAADLSLAADVERVQGRIAGLDDLELLVNNAGYGIPGSFDQSSLGKQVEMVDVHVLASMRLARAALPSMVARRSGAIINVASLAAFVPLPGSANYCATKAYLVAFSEALQAEVMQYGVRVQALCPGFVNTSFHDRGEFSRFDRTRFPEFAWMSAESVVRESLDGLAEGRVICVPGLFYRAISAVVRFAPSHALIRTILSFAPVQRMLQEI
jgi:short-subunit dehydrogenase